MYNMYAYVCIYIYVIYIYIYVQKTASQPAVWVLDLLVASSRPH